MNLQKLSAQVVRDKISDYAKDQYTNNIKAQHFYKKWDFVLINVFLIDSWNKLIIWVLSILK